ncbi:MAG: glycosyltransferase family 4 protein [Gammaproteobacteria bacterium]|nr:glycosyltransferase family 4 protein [Gammaproteobacteria bacterium]
MKIAFCLFRYFPYGGLQRDFLRLAKLFVSKGHQLTVYTMKWEEKWERSKIDNIKINIIKLPIYSLTNHDRAIRFSKVLQRIFKAEAYDLIIGFNKMPGLDYYYCADSCYVTKVDAQKARHIKLFYSLTSRYKKFKFLEESVFDPQNNTKILFLSRQEQINYQNYYGTQSERCFLLPPNIDKARFQLADLTDITEKSKLKQDLIQEVGLDNISQNNKWLLMVGSGFKTKGVARSIRLVKHLVDLNLKVNLIIIGQDNPSDFIKLATELNINNFINFLPGRDDIANFMNAADLLVHPAYRENTGTVILESIIMGLPVVASGTCGYAEYINQSGCGKVIDEPFVQESFNQNVYQLLNDNNQLLSGMRKNGLEFRETAEIYHADDKILEIIDQNE